MFEIVTDIPHGNAALARMVDEDGIPAVHFAAHPHGGTETLWWCFRVQRRDFTGSSPRLRLVWNLIENTLGFWQGAAENAHPVMRAPGQPWTRLEGGVRRTGSDALLSAVWEVDAPETWAEFAFCFPHGPGELDALVADTGWRRSEIGVSLAGRPVVRIANDYGDSEEKRPGVYCLAHQHASEMSGAWALDGFVRRMAELGDDAPLVWSVPVTNIDGTVEGDYGKDPFPWDLNRAWGVPPMRPETLALRRDICRWKERCAPALALDFHSPGGSETGGVYTFVPDPETRGEDAARVEPWADAIDEALGEWAAPDFSRVAKYPSRFNNDPNFTRCCMQEFNVTALTFEVPYGRVMSRVLTIEDYQAIGARIADAVAARMKG